MIILNNETEKYISQLEDACNISIGYAMYKWYGITNKYILNNIYRPILEI
jgi:hypothetical protein